MRALGVGGVASLCARHCSRDCSRDCSPDCSRDCSLQCSRHRARQRDRHVVGHRARQSGVAIVTALLMTTLAVSAVASLFWQQQVQVRAMENQRLHVRAQWLLRAGLDSTRLVLRQDAERYPDITTLDGGWNGPPVEIRLDQDRERQDGADGKLSNLSNPGDDGNHGDDADQAGATISNHIIDAQSRFNLANLATESTLNLAEIGAFERLLAGLRLDPSLALRTARALAAGQAGALAAGVRQAAPRRLDELSGVSGYTPAVLAALSGFVVLLPEPADLNLDTAAPELLAAAAGLSLAEAQALATRRRQAHFRTMDEFGAALRDRRPLEGLRVGLKSDYFLVRSQVRLDRAALDAVSLIYRARGAAPATELVWTRNE